MSLTFPDRQVQRKVNHAGDFGMVGTYNAANAQRFRKAVEAHDASPTTRVIHGVFSRGPGTGGFAATFYLDQTSRLVVVTDASDRFVTGYKLSTDQANSVLRHGKLGGGV